jgi:hypothetical protein
MRILLVPLLVLAASTAPGTRIDFHPREKSELAKRFETSVSLGLDDLTLEMNGEEVDPQMFLGEMDLDSANMQATLSVAVHDTYVALGEGRPTELVREYKSIRGDFKDGMGTSQSEDLDDSGLIGRSVRFVWNPDEETYARTFETEGGDEESLAVLSEDMDLRDLLPEGDVEDGAEWPVSWADHLGLILPGLDLPAAWEKLSAEMESDTDEDAVVPRAILQTLFDGIRTKFADASATCTSKGTREVEGRKMSVIGIESKIDGTLDLSPFADAVGDEIPDAASVNRLDLDLSLEISGELVWDLAEGHFHSLELSGEISGEMSLDLSLEMDENTFEGSAKAEYSGKLSRSATLE